MTDMFQNVLTASFHGSIVILAVLLLRFLLKKTPKKFLCFLWLLAGIRLLMPFEIQSGLSLQPDVDAIPQPRFSQVGEAVLPAETVPAVSVETPVPQSQQPMMPVPVQPMPEMEENLTAQPTVEAMAEPAGIRRLDEIAANIWLAVAFGFLLYTFASYLRLKLQVREAIRLKGNIWECDKIETAFILGFIRPQIYLPMGMSQNNRRHILAHERTHLEKGDHWIKMIGFVALAIHWFNPLVWLAYILLCKDIEMACDERVVQFMELEERKSYSAALVNCSTNHAHFAACPVAFGEVSVKNRVISVLKYKKPSFWISLAGVLAILFVAVCFVTSPTEEADPEFTPESTEETLPPREVVTVTTVEELLSAIAPDTEIILEAGVYNLSTASGYGGDSGGDYYRWQPVSDGYELVLEGLENFAIRGSGTHVTLIETDPRFADVIVLLNCHDVELEGFTGGHTRLRGECGGGVVNLTDSSGIDLHQLGLYGCGMVGLETQRCQKITMTDCDIYECSFAAVNLNSVQDAVISGCRMYNIGEEHYAAYTYLDVWESTGVVVENCEFSGSNIGNLFCVYGGGVELKNNLIANNRVTASAMILQSMDTIPCDVTLSGNKFTGNSIRSWYNTSTATAVDEKGRLLTEDVLMDAYGTEPTEPKAPQLQIHVSTVDEFIAAIGPDKEIILDAALYDFSTATGYGTSSGEYYFWEDVFDGPGLVIQNVSNLTIRSNDGNVKGHTLAAVPRYADVLAFRACDNITLSGFTAGHTLEQGSCAGGVLEFRDCDVITVDNCGLFGCGILGVETQSCADVTVKNCDIYECSNGGIQMWDTYGVTLENNTFRDIGGRYIMQFNSCKNVVLDGEEIIGEALYSHSISSPEQEELAGLQNIVWYFPDYFCDGEKENLSGLLASTYTGEITVWSNTSGLDNAFLPDVTLETLEAFKRKGEMEFSVPIQPWSYEQSMYQEAVAVLNFTVIKENGEYKVSDYYLVQDEG